MAGMNRFTWKMLTFQDIYAKCSEAQRGSNRHAKPKDEVDGKEHAESPNQQQVVESMQNNRFANLSAQVKDVNKQNLHWITSPASSVLGFAFHTAFWVHNKYNSGFGRSKAGRTTKTLLTISNFPSWDHLAAGTTRFRMHFDSSGSVSPFMTLIMRNANENVGRNIRRGHTRAKEAS